MLQQNGSFKGIIVNSANTTANEEGYTIRLRASQWKIFQSNQSSASSGSAEAMRLKITKDASGFISFNICAVCEIVASLPTF